jgi:hypothetical protein
MTGMSWKRLLFGVSAAIALGLLVACTPTPDWPGSEQVQMHVLDGLLGGESANLGRIQPRPEGGFIAAGVVTIDSVRSTVVTVMNPDETFHHHLLDGVTGYPKSLNLMEDGSWLLSAEDQKVETSPLEIYRLQLEDDATIVVSHMGSVPVLGDLWKVISSNDHILITGNLEYKRTFYQVIHVSDELTEVASEELEYEWSRDCAVWGEDQFTLLMMNQNQGIVIQLDDEFIPERKSKIQINTGTLTLLSMAADADRVAVLGVTHTMDGLKMVEQQHMWYGSLTDDHLQQLTLDVDHIILGFDMFFLNENELVIGGTRPIRYKPNLFCTMQHWIDATFIHANLATGEVIDYPRDVIDATLVEITQGADGRIFGVGSISESLEKDARRDAAWFEYELR